MRAATSKKIASPENGASALSHTLAVMVHGAGDLRLEEVPVPALGPGQVQIAIAAGGICGSDLHYYRHGHIGPVVLRQPMVLGHEISGIVTGLGPEVSQLAIGARVAINPSLACGQCRFCRAGLAHHCLDMRFYGSAMRMPHVHGGFRRLLVAEARQCVALPPDFPLEKAAFAEPLAVCLHAVERAGPLAGRKVLVTGCGPIGALTILAARHAGAETIVATDIADPALALARRIGADHTINVAENLEELQAFSANKGHFDVVFEASGQESALRIAMEVVRARGILVLVGLGGETQLMINLAVNKEIDLRGSFRFDGEFDQAVRAIVSGRIDPMPLLSDSLPMAEAVQAFELAADRKRAMKVQINFS